MRPTLLCCRLICSTFRPPPADEFAKGTEAGGGGRAGKVGLDPNHATAKKRGIVPFQLIKQRSPGTDRQADRVDRVLLH